MSKISKKDLPDIIVKTLKTHGSLTRMEVAWKISPIVKLLVDDNDPFIITWYYDLGWAKTELKESGIIGLKKGSEPNKPKWYLK